jgi:hypothetical protein
MHYRAFLDINTSFGCFFRVFVPRRIFGEAWLLIKRKAKVNHIFGAIKQAIKSHYMILSIKLMTLLFLSDCINDEILDWNSL